MNSFVIFTGGLFIGAVVGFSVCSWMTMGKITDLQDELDRLRPVGNPWMNTDGIPYSDRDD